MRWMALSTLFLASFSQTASAQQNIGQGIAEVWSSLQNFSDDSEADPAPSPFAESRERPAPVQIAAPIQENKSKPTSIPSQPNLVQPLPSVNSMPPAPLSHPEMAETQVWTRNMISPHVYEVGGHAPAMGVDHSATSPHRKLLSLMQCNEFGDVWAGYSQQRAAEIARQLQHVHGLCDCSRLYSHACSGCCEHGRHHHAHGFNRYTQPACGSACGQGCAKQDVVPSGSHCAANAIPPNTVPVGTTVSGPSNDKTANLPATQSLLRPEIQPVSAITIPKEAQFRAPRINVR